MILSSVSILMNKPLLIDTSLVRTLVSNQFPHWKHLGIKPVAQSGWDNRTFHLGQDMLVRMPSAPQYTGQVEKENYWLPRLGPSLPLPIPVPLALGRPDEGYPWRWSIYRWIDGDSAAATPPSNLNEFATHLAQFLIALQNINSTNGPLPGPQNFYRGGALSTYDAQTKQALALLKNTIDAAAALKIWQAALTTSWTRTPVWVHGDISLGNLLVQEGRLSAVIDFGQLAVGDPACDLAIAWTLFEGTSRTIFRTALSLDEETWARGRAWALWKALIVASGLTKSNATEGTSCLHSIENIIQETR